MNFVADKRIALFVETGAQNNLIELVNTRQWEQRIVQPARTVVATKIKAEGKFASRSQTRSLVIATLHPNAAVGLESGIVLGPDPFHRRRTLPGETVLRGIVI